MKTLKEGSSDEDRVKFLQEAAIMCQFRHPNVVTMYGVVTDGDPVSPYVSQALDYPNHEPILKSRTLHYSSIY